MNIQGLRNAGIDYEAGVSRFMGDAALYEAVLSAFLSDQALEAAQHAFDEGDHRALLTYAHEIKGSSGNTDMTRLYEASCSLVKLLRRDAYTAAELDIAFTAFKNAYLCAREGILSAMEE